MKMPVHNETGGVTVCRHSYFRKSFTSAPLPKMLPWYHLELGDIGYSY